MHRSQNFLAEAYIILFSQRPTKLQQWQIAEELISGFDGRLFVGDERKEKIVCAALAFIIGYVEFPVDAKYSAVYMRAIGFLMELDPNICNIDVNESLGVHLLGRYEEALLAMS